MAVFETTWWQNKTAMHDFHFRSWPCCWNHKLWKSRYLARKTSVVDKGRGINRYNILNAIRDSCLGEFSGSMMDSTSVTRLLELGVTQNHRINKSMWRSSLMSGFFKPRPSWNYTGLTAGEITRLMEMIRRNGIRDIIIITWLNILFVFVRNSRLLWLHFPPQCF